MQPHIDQVIQKNSPFNREYLKDLTKCPKLGCSSEIIYIYSLLEDSITYPNKLGSVLYIGEAQKNEKPTGARFVDHISPDENKGGTGGLNHGLSRYYWQDIKMRLRVFLVEPNEARKSVETNLLQLHVKEFGALPMCQGTTSDTYHTTKLSNLNDLFHLPLLSSCFIETM